MRRRAQIGRLLTFSGFGALIGGLLYSLFGMGSQDSNTILVSYIALISGYVLITAGKGYWLKFAVHPRPDESLALNLKTFDVRTVLYNYVSDFPVEHLLSTTSGLVVVETRPLVGDIVVQGEKWSRQRGVFAWLQMLSEGRLGNPAADARRGVDAVKKLLAERLDAEAAEKIPVLPMVVFTHPRVTLKVEDSTVAVCRALDARNEIKRILGAGKIPGDVLRRMESMLAEQSSSAGEAVNAGDAIDKKVRRRKMSRAR